MRYDPQIIKSAHQALESARTDRASQLRQRLDAAYEEVPRLRQIDSQLVRTMALAAQAALTPGTDGPAAMEQARQQNQALQAERDALVSAHFPVGYLDETPICTVCGGTGYMGSTMCGCLEKLCRQEQRKNLQLLACGTCDFGDFSLNYYSNTPDPRYGASPRTFMTRTLNHCRAYADTFSPVSGNLLFVGGTGLGKTFLSACIASTVVEKGYSVCYEPASKLFAKLEKARFSPTEEAVRQVDTLEQCDLLILDDLGTELPGNFVTAALFDLVNDRLLREKPTIISTNLNIDEISHRYSPQLASRLQGSYRCFTFVGDDIRILKNRG